MDIDSPPASLPEAQPISLPHFSASFPLPFRVLFLVGLAQLLWAVNLQILHRLGFDTAWILDFRDSGDDDGIDLGDPTSGARAPERLESGRLYQPVYKVFGLYSAWVGSGWLLFRFVTGGVAERMESARWLVGVIGIGAAIGTLAPWRGIGERERRALRLAVKRILLPPTDAPIYFGDVVLADILTSFAKVLGDLWISTCQIWYGGITQGRVKQTGWSSYITLIMVCLPYLVRFRQCLVEFYQSGWKNPRPLANALKYFSAFPVIILSAAQKTVVTDVAAAKGVSVQDIAASGDRWFGEHPIFRMWLLAVVVNSMYSFWWDIEMDWGLALCEVDTWFGPAPHDPATSPISRARRGSDLSLVGRFKRLVRRQPSISHQRSPMPTPSPSFVNGAPPSSSGSFFTFGLRPTLLLPDPLVYHIFAAIDLVLRFTWSLKLSSNLYTISEIESGVFMMEALELVRRWMWVFIRVEWEAVKMGEGRGWARASMARQDGEIMWEQKDEEGDG